MDESRAHYLELAVLELLTRVECLEKALRMGPAMGNVIGPDGDARANPAQTPDLIERHR